MSTSTAPGGLDSWWKSKDRDVGRDYTVGEKLTGPPAERMIELSGITKTTTTTPLTVLDNACGNGIVMQILYDGIQEQQRSRVNIIAGDFSESQVKMAQARIEKNQWIHHAKAEVIDMQDMKTLNTSSVTHIFTNFGVAFAPDPDKTLREMLRVLKPGGVTAFTTWTEVGWIKIVKAALATIPDCPAIPDSIVFLKTMQNNNAWQETAYIDAKLQEHGFTDIKVATYSEPQVFSQSTFADTFGGPMAKAMLRSFWTKEEIGVYGDQLRPAIYDYLQKSGDGEVAFIMNAIVSVAKKPSVD